MSLNGIGTMGQITPNRPRGVRPDPPPAPPAYHAPTAAPVAPRLNRCEYCRRGGVELTQCEGCGATVPAAAYPYTSARIPARRPHRIER